MRIWLDRGYSMSHIAERMAAAVPGLRIMMNPRQLSPMWCAEGANLPEAGPDWGARIAPLLEEHQVDAVVLQRLAGRVEHDHPSIHQAASAETLDLLEDKIAFAASVDPDRRIDADVVIDESGLRDAVAAVVDRGGEACIKPVRGVNGSGFWRFAQGDPVVLLDRPEDRDIDIETYAIALRRSPGVDARMVMEWLPGPEASVDVLCWRGEPLAHATRIKESADVQLVTTSHEVMGHAYGLCRQHALHGIVSIQYRLDRHGRWRVLEINPRPAGGCIYSEDAGAGLIAGWTHLLLDQADPSDIAQRDLEIRMRKRSGADIIHE